MKRYITDNTETQVATGRVSKVIVQVNAALTGTIKVIDGVGSTTTANVATITNPTVGSRFEYWDFGTGCKIIASTTCDITVSASQARGMQR